MMISRLDLQKVLRIRDKALLVSEIGKNLLMETLHRTEHPEPRLKLVKRLAVESHYKKP